MGKYFQLTQSIFAVKETEYGTNYSILTVLCIRDCTFGICILSTVHTGHSTVMYSHTYLLVWSRVEPLLEGVMYVDYVVGDVGMEQV